MKRIALLAVLCVFSVMSFVQAAETAKNPVVKIATSKGDIWVELNAEKAPVTVKNFLSYTKDGFYSDTIFHRVIKGFMIQGGGMTANMQKKPTKAPIKNEASNGLKNKRGTIAMARTGNPHSATSQFFINHVDNTFLDFRDPSPRGIGYAVFGKVVKGMDVVDAIAAGATRKPGDVPVKTVTIKSVTVANKKAGACCGTDGKCCKSADAAKKGCGCAKACDKQAECKKDCDKCPDKATCTKNCPKKASCCKDGKCTKEDCTCCKDGKCCGEDCKCCKVAKKGCGCAKTCDKQAECKKDCDKCPSKETCTKKCPKQGCGCSKKSDKPAADAPKTGCGCGSKKAAKPVKPAAEAPKTGCGCSGR